MALRDERRSVLTQEQLTRLLKVLKLVPALRNAVVLAVSTGLRLGKIANLERDLRQDTDGSWHLSLYDKNGDLHRAYLFGEAEEIARRAAANESTRYLISGPNGGKLRPKYVHGHLKHCCELAGIPYSGTDYDGFCFHRLRALFASNLLNSGLDIETVAKAGNWKSLVIVQRYAKLPDSRKNAAFKLAADAFGKT